MCRTRKKGVEEWKHNTKRRKQKEAIGRGKCMLLSFKEDCAKGAASQEGEDRKSFYRLIFLATFTPESLLMTCRQCNNLCGCFVTVLLRCADVPSREEEEKKEI